MDDPDVWMRASTLENGIKYYAYVLLYVENCFVISEKAEDILQKDIGKYFELKEESISTIPLTWWANESICTRELRQGMVLWICKIS